MNANIRFPRGANLRRLFTFLLVGFVFAARATAAWVWVDGYSVASWVPGHEEVVVDTPAYDAVEGHWESETEWVEVVIHVDATYHTIWIDGYWEEIWVDGYWEWEGGEPQP